MPVRWIAPDESLNAERAGVVVCIPVYGAHEDFLACLRSVLEHTAEAVPILICDDASPDARTAQAVRELAETATTGHRVFYLHRERNLGFPGNVNGAFELAAPADVVVLNSDCLVAAGWLGGLVAAARSDSRVATVSALTNRGTLVSVPDRGRPSPRLPDGWSFERAATVVRERSLRLHPTLPTAIGHCMYVRRAALDLVGGFDLAFSPGYGEEVDFSQRCLQAGFTHRLADDVLVFHCGGASFAAAGEVTPLQRDHEQIIERRYSYYHAAVRAAEEDVSGPLARSLSSARRAIRGLSVVIDARVLDGALTGTQLHVIEMIAALSRCADLRVTALVPERPGEDARAALGHLQNVELASRAHLEGGVARADVVHRPFQINDDEDLSFLSGLGDRLIITQQDLISYHNPSYFSDFDTWEGYRRITRMALTVSDRVLFFSDFARSDALAEDLVAPDRASVVHIGVDHALIGRGSMRTRPPAATGLGGGEPVILCLGTDFRHKNRLFALRVLRELIENHGWKGRLLFAGPPVRRGSSRTAERAWLARHPHAAAYVDDLGEVSEAEKAWLYERTSLVLYPSLHEGFGLVPFEAFVHGVPCLWARGTALAELLPGEAAGLTPWAPGPAAEAALALLSDERARATNLEAIGAAAAGRTWDATARALVEIYEHTCDEPASQAGALERRHGTMAGAFTEDAMRLVGPSGALPRELERPLLALATHPALARPAFGAVRWGYQAAWRLRRLRRR